MDLEALVDQKVLVDLGAQVVLVDQWDPVDLKDRVVQDPLETLVVLEVLEDLVDLVGQMVQQHHMGQESLVVL